jgi:fibronectin-binding autotransporter adhesin
MQNFTNNYWFDILKNQSEHPIISPNTISSMKNTIQKTRFENPWQITILLVFMMLSSLGFSQVTKTTVSAGTWNTPARWSPAGVPAAGDNIIIAHAITADVAITMNNLTVNSGATLTMQGLNVTVNGNTQINGTLADNNNAGTNAFAGTFNITAGGSFNTTSTSPLLFGGNISNAGTFNRTGAGNVNFSDTLSINGPNAVVMGGGALTVDADVVVTNNTILSISGVLNGATATSSFINSTNATLNYSGATLMASGLFDASALNNTINYSGGGNQTVRSSSYHNIGFSGGGTKTVTDIVVNGNFTRTASTLSFTGASTLTFEGSNAVNLTLAGASYTFPNVIINKPGGSLTLVPGGTTTSTMASLSIPAGDFILGSTAHTVRVNGDLAGAGSITMAGANHSLRLFGVNNAIGTLNSGTSTVEYAATVDQNIFDSPNYYNILLSGSGIKSLNGAVTVSNQLNLSTNNLFLSLGTSNLRLSPSATLAGTFGTSRYIITDGSGNFIKEGTSTTDFTADLPGGIFPIGNSGGLYTPFTLSVLTATITGTGAISVRAVPTRQPNVPYFNNALIKYWDIVTTNLSGISANASFTYRPSEIIGNALLYQPRVWNGITLSAPAGPSATGVNPASTTATTFLTGQWTALDPAIRTTIYSYQSGDWGDLNTWTIDPSGSTLLNPIIPSGGDQVIILPGRTVTTSVARTCGTLEIQAGGVLDLGTSPASTLGTVSGEGTLKISATASPAAFPLGTFTSFVSAAGGTVEYYNLPATCVLPTLATYNNLSITNSTATSFTAQVNGVFTLNGNLDISKSSTGAANFNLGTGGNYTILGNISIAPACRFGIATSTTAGMNLFVSGNITVDGQLILQNGAAYTTSSGRAALTMRGATANTVVSFNAGSTATLYDVYVEKNVGYEAFFTASPTASVNFHGAAYTILPIRGTMRLGQNLTIPRMGSVGNYDLGSTTVLPTLWIDGAIVTDGGVGGAIVPYGTLKITAGSLTCTNGQRSVVLRESGTFEMQGGTVNMGLFRTSNQLAIGVHRGSFIMSGGTLNLDGNSSLAPDYAIFSLAYPENGFTMSGGTINVTRISTGGTCPTGGIAIGSNAQNYNVTGGTINMNITGNFNIDIASRAPFFNLNINRPSGTGTGQARLGTINFNDGSANSLPAQPLTILNTLNFVGTNAFTFNAQGNSILVAGDFNVNTGTTLISGNNTLTFNGNSAQTFTVNGSIPAPGLGSLTVNKGSSSTLNIAGGVASIPAAGGLSILNGTLNDGGKTLSFAGNVVNNATHIGTGKISLNGTTAQTIDGNGNGVFQNLELASASGAVGSVGVSALNTVRVNGNLNLATDRLFNIGIYRLILPAAATITGTFGNNRYIQTAGFQSDGGIVKTFNATTPVVFPFGTASNNYTPATIQFASAPASWGSLNVRPVSNRQLYVTDPDCFVYYWKVRGTGFSGVAANSINHTYSYGNLPDNAAYIPAYYNYQNIAFTTINDVNQVNETNNTILFNGVSYFDGDFTAGAPAAFGIVVPYYSRANGNWNVASTWSNTTFGGPASATTPTSSTPVFIGDGSNYFHTVTVTTNNTVSGSLIVDAGSTLNLGTTTGHNFGALPFATAGGAGKIQISASGSTAEFPGGDFGIFFTAEGGTTQYTSTSSDFTIPTVTAAPTNMTIPSYRNLILSPGVGRVINMPNSNLDIFENVTVLGAVGGIAKLNGLASRTLSIAGNLDVAQGTLQFPAGANQVIDIAGNCTVGNAGTFDVENAGTAQHSINLTGNLVNNGAIEFNLASKANLNFIGNLNRAISGTNGLASTSLNQLTLNKGTGNSVILDVTVAGSLTAPSNNWLNMVNGTFRLSKAASLTLTDQPATNFLIPSSAAIVVNNPSAIINVAMANSNTSDLQLAGELRILDGTVNVGSDANNVHNDLEYASTGSPLLYLEGNALLSVNGQIRRSVLNLLGSLNYTQKGNSTVLVRGKNPGATQNTNHQRAKFEILNEGSSFTMEDNAMLIVDRSGLASLTFGDVYIEPETSVITGGDIVIGTASTPSTESLFLLNATPALNNLVIDGSVSPKTLRMFTNPLTVRNNLNILGNSIFDANSLNVTIGGNLTNQNPITTIGLNAGGYRPISTTQVTTFNGVNAAQAITGTGSNVTNFANLVINNSQSGGQLTANNAIQVNADLSVLEGNMILNGSNATVSRNITNNSTISTLGAANLILNGSAAQDIFGNGSGVFGAMRINNLAGVELRAPISVMGVLNLQAGLFYINNHILTLGTAASVTGTFSANTMIRTNGVLSDGGVRKMVPATAQDFTFPIGVTLKYTPARINITANANAGSVTVKPVNTKHPATTDPTDKELGYYWNTESSGFGAGTTVNHTYTYIQGDALNGLETAYRAGRFFNNVWAPQFGIVGSVNSTLNTINLTGVNYFDGDFTAGEQTEFDQLLVFYSRVSSGSFDDPTSWSTDPVLQHDGAAAVSIPNFNTFVIKTGHAIDLPSNNKNAPIAEINGTLNLFGTIGHNFGTVSGTGTIKQNPTVTNTFVFPGGNYSAFVAAGGGTFEFNSSANATLPSQATYNNLVISGTGAKTMANVDLLINGNLTILQGSLNNSNNRNINLKGNLTNNNGVSGFIAGNGVFSLTGAAQVLSGATQFTRLTVNGAGIKTLNASVNVNTALVLTSGIISTGLNQITLSSAATVTGGSAISHIDGNLQKGIASSTSLKQFEIGDGSVYTPVSINFNGNTNGTGNLIVSTTNGEHPNVLTSTLDPNKSVNRYYSIINTGVTGFTAAAATFTFATSDVDGGSNTSNFVIGRNASGSWTLPTVGVRTATSTQATGLTAFGDFQIAEEYVGGLVWNGSVSADWNNAANWTPAFVPGLSDDVTINPGTFQPSFLSAGNGSCRDITFTAGTSLTVPTGFTLTVAGNWSGINTNVVGQGTVNFTSPAAVHSGNTAFGGVLSVATGANLNTGDGITLKNNASLMHGAGTAGAGGNISGRIIVQRTGQTSSTSYNYWSSPISNGTMASLGGNRYFYNPNGATANDFEGLRQGWTSATGAMTIGRGYAATGTGTANFNGFVNNGNISFGPTVLGTHTAFNLVGNPYPSAISAAAFVAANPNISGQALYFWDDDGSAGAGFNAAQDYAVWNSLGIVGPNSGTSFTGNIASCQAFFIQSTSSSLVQFNNGMRTTSNNAFFVDDAIQRLWISVTTEANDYNETLIAFRNDATEGIDPQYDANKFRGNEHIALYSKSGNSDLAIQAIPELDTDRVVQLGLEADVAGPQTLRLKQADNLTENVQVILEDTKLGIFQNLQNNPVYHFNYTVSEDVNRFKLHFMPGVFMSASSESCAQNDGSIQLSSPSETVWNYTVTNSNGAIVAQGEDFSGTTSVNNLAGGVYQVNLNNTYGSSIEQMLTIAAGQAVTATLQASETEAIAAQTAIAFEAIVNGASDFTWNFGDGSSVSGILNPLHVYTQPGVYTVTFIASNATCMEIKTIEVRVSAATTGLANQTAEVFSIFPNPAEDFTLVQLNLPENEATLRFDVLDMSGRLVMSRSYNQVAKVTQLEIDLSSLKAGVYQLLVRGEKFSTASRFTKAD